MFHVTVKNEAGVVVFEHRWATVPSDEEVASEVFSAELFRHSREVCSAVRTLRDFEPKVLSCTTLGGLTVELSE